MLAAVYHHENYEAVCNVVRDLDPDDAGSIEKAQDLMEDPAVKEELEFVATHFSFINYAIKGLQEQGWSLANQLQYYEDAKAKFVDVPGKYGDLVRGKFDRVEERNPGIQQLFQVRDLQLAHPGGYTDLINCLKFAVTVSVDCERT